VNEHRRRLAGRTIHQGTNLSPTMTVSGECFYPVDLSNGDISRADPTGNVVCYQRLYFELDNSQKLTYECSIA
jgi:hypothetical protein